MTTSTTASTAGKSPPPIIGRIGYFITCLSIAMLCSLILSGCGALIAPRHEVTEAKAPVDPNLTTETWGAAAPDLPASSGSVGVGEYRVAKGDTLYAIARRHNVPPAQLASLNELPPPYGVKAGQMLKVPGAGVANEVRVMPAAAPGPKPPVQAAPRTAVAQAALTPPAIPAAATATEPTAKAAVPKPQATKKQLAATPAAPAATPAPVIQPPVQAPEQQVAIPPVLPEPIPATATLPTIDESSFVNADAPAAVPVAAVPAGVTPAAAKSELAKLPPPPARSGAGFMRPVEGRTLISFGKQPGGLVNDGINIAAPKGAIVKAADNGVVVYAGNELRGFGNMLVVRHEGGWMTAYAHLEKMQVNRGEKVTRGQRIGTVGMSGNAATPQLHFEVRRGKQPVDPEQQMTAGTPRVTDKTMQIGALR